jgi:large subunit ribosomal protein L4
MMATIDVMNLKKEKMAQIELNDLIFQSPIKKSLIHQVVMSQLVSRRSGNAATKTRSEVNRSGKKLYRQKGTGRARAGDASSPTRRGGGVIFGPKPRKYTYKVSKKVRKKALCMALSDKFNESLLYVLSDFNLPEIKTKNFVEIMENFGAVKPLIITDEKNEILEKSSRNVSWVKVLNYQGLNVYDILNHNELFVIQPAIPKIEEALVS